MSRLPGWYITVGYVGFSPKPEAARYTTGAISRVKWGWNITFTTRDFGPVLQKIARIQLRKLCVPKKSCTSWKKHEQSKMGSFKNLRWTCFVYCISHVSLSSKPCIVCLSTFSKCIYTWVYLHILHILYIQLSDKNMILHQETLMYVYVTWFFWTLYTIDTRQLRVHGPKIIKQCI